MKKFFLCLLLAALTASLRVEFEWERNARREWHAYTEAVQSELAIAP